MSKSLVDQVASAIRFQVQVTYRQVERYPWEDRVRYAQWLAQTYYYVRRVTHVLAAGASRTPVGETLLHNHFLRGITEERDHDILAVNDLRELGFSVEQFPEHPLTKAYYQSLFYMIDHAGPAAILGYFFVLEGMAGGQGGALYDRVAATYGERSSTFLKEHVIHDAEHFPAALSMLEALEPAQLAIVKDSAELSGSIYRYMVEAMRTEPLASSELVGKTS